MLNQVISWALSHSRCIKYYKILQYCKRYQIWYLLASVWGAPGSRWSPTKLWPFYNVNWMFRRCITPVFKKEVGRRTLCVRHQYTRVLYASVWESKGWEKNGISDKKEWEHVGSVILVSRQHVFYSRHYIISDPWAIRMPSSAQNAFFNEIFFYESPRAMWREYQVCIWRECCCYKQSTQDPQCCL